MVFVDANIVMYQIGADHPNKGATSRALSACSKAREVLVTDAEVYQEILHRYVSLRRPDAIPPAFRLLGRLAKDAFDITSDDTLEAAALAGSHPWLSARDCLHLAVMRRHHVYRILTFDTDFDRIPWVQRVYV